MTYQKAADRGVDLPEDVADHVQSCNKAELQSVVDHHVDEHDVPRVLIEETGVKDKQVQTKYRRAATDHFYELSIYLLIDLLFGIKSVKKLDFFFQGVVIKCLVLSDEQSQRYSYFSHKILNCKSCSKSSQ